MKVHTIFIINFLVNESGTVFFFMGRRDWCLLSKWDDRRRFCMVVLEHLFLWFNGKKHFMRKKSKEYFTVIHLLLKYILVNDHSLIKISYVVNKYTVKKKSSLQNKNRWGWGVGNPHLKSENDKHTIERAVKITDLTNENATPQFQLC